MINSRKIQDDTSFMPLVPTSSSLHEQQACNNSRLLELTNHNS